MCQSVGASPDKAHGKDGVEGDSEIVVVAVFGEVLRIGRMGFKMLTRPSVRGTVLQIMGSPWCICQAKT